MNQKQTYSNCKHFTFQSCLYIKEQLMADFVREVKYLPSGSKPRPVDYSKGEEVNKKICHDCRKFESDKT